MEDYSVWMVGGTLLLVADKVPLAQRQAVFDSLLYAQLVANKSAGSRFTGYRQWYGDYRHTLAARGWIMTQYYNESRPTKDYSCLGPLQPLQLWLETRYGGASNIVAQGVDRLLRDPAKQDSFRQFTVEGDTQGSGVTLEVGLVHPGPVINLCSIALHTSTAADQIAMDRPLAGEALIGDVFINGVSAVLDDEVFEPQRADLRGLIARKQKSQCFIQDVGAQPGGQHG